MSLIFTGQHEPQGNVGPDEEGAMVLENVPLKLCFVVGRRRCARVTEPGGHSGRILPVIQRFRLLRKIDQARMLRRRVCVGSGAVLKGPMGGFGWAIGCALRVSRNG